MFSDIYRFVSCVVPSEADSDDVVVSPYNAVLASRTLREDASCVLPVGNDALMNICSTIKESKPDSRQGSAITDTAKLGQKIQVQNILYIKNKFTKITVLELSFVYSLNI